MKKKIVLSFSVLILSGLIVSADMAASMTKGHECETSKAAALPCDSENRLANDSTKALALWDAAAKALAESYEVIKEVELPAPDKIGSAIQQALTNLQSSDNTEQLKASILLLKAEAAYKNNPEEYASVKEYLPMIEKAMATLNSKNI